MVTRKRFARTRAAVRRALAAVLPAGVTDTAHAVYLGRWWLARAGDADEPDIAVARALLVEGDVCVDGGANFGRFADAFAGAVGRSGRVVAIEPIPRTARLLRSVMRHRGRSNVEVLEVALAAKPGLGRMEIPAGPSGGSNFFRAHLSDSQASDSVEVRLETLDRIAHRLARAPSLVKLDLEGFERQALLGAGSILRMGAAWLLEMNDDPDEAGSDAYAIEAEMATHGYTPWIYDVRARMLHRRRSGPRGPNVFFLLPSHVERLHGADVQFEPDETSRGS